MNILGMGFAKKVHLDCFDNCFEASGDGQLSTRFGVSAWCLKFGTNLRNYYPTQRRQVSAHFLWLKLFYCLVFWKYQSICVACVLALSSRGMKLGRWCCCDQPEGLPRRCLEFSGSHKGIVLGSKVAGGLIFEVGLLWRRRTGVRQSFGFLCSKTMKLSSR